MCAAPCSCAKLQPHTHTTAGPQQLRLAERLTQLLTQAGLGSGPGWGWGLGSGAAMRQWSNLIWAWAKMDYWPRPQFMQVRRLLQPQLQPMQAGGGRLGAAATAGATATAAGLTEATASTALRGPAACCQRPAVVGQEEGLLLQPLQPGVTTMPFLSHEPLTPHPHPSSHNTEP